MGKSTLTIIGYVFQGYAEWVHQHSSRDVVSCGRTSKQRLGLTSFLN